MPAFFFVAIGGPFARRVRHWPVAAAALDGVNAASLALMATVVLLPVRGVSSSASGLFIALAATFLLLRTQIGAGWLLLCGALVGIVQVLLVKSLQRNFNRSSRCPRVG